MLSSRKFVIWRSLFVLTTFFIIVCCQSPGVIAREIEVDVIIKEGESTQPEISTTTVPDKADTAEPATPDTDQTEQPSTKDSQEKQDIPQASTPSVTETDKDDTKESVEDSGDSQTGTEQVDVKTILADADASRGNTSGIVWDVTMKVQGGQEVADRVLKVKTKGASSLAVFQAPNDVKGQMLLMKQNNMWYIKPGLSKPISISPRQRLIGGAANADIASTNYAGDYDSKIIGTESVNGTECYAMDLKANSSKVTYDRIKYWVSKDKNLGLKAEFYSVSDKLLKTADFKYDNTFKANGGQRPFISEMRIEDAVIKDSVTTMTYKDIQVVDVPDSTFNLQNLTN